jgi:hypothetical protein
VNNKQVKYYQAQWLGRFIRISLMMKKLKISTDLKDIFIILLKNNKEALVDAKLLQVQHIKMIVNYISSNPPNADIIRIFRSMMVMDQNHIPYIQKLIFTDFLANDQIKGHEYKCQFDVRLSRMSSKYGLNGRDPGD